jgi:hypothetical protein
VREAALRIGCLPDSRDPSDIASIHAGKRALDLVDNSDVYLAFGPSDALAEQERLRATERGIPVFDFPDMPAETLEAEVVEALTALTTESVAEGVRAIPKPPALYANPPYLLTYTFIGRWQELHELDQWAESGESAMVYEAIGGIGKSALVWEWLESHSHSKIPGLAGRLWWSFYERGSSLRGFVRHALAYVSDEDIEEYRHLDDAEAVKRLVTALRAKPYLLVLDGFERLLAAYHHLDKAQIRDDRVREDLRQSTNPQDGDLMRALVDCAPSKILVTSRLMPKALEDCTRHYVLPGLTPRDAESLVRAAGIKGSTQKIQDFAGQFGCHALVLRVVCGMVNDYAPEPGFFDRWLDDPEAGGALADATSHSRILEFAIARLAPLERQLLSRIAVLRDTATYETIRVLSPFGSPVELHAALKRLEAWELLQWDRHVNTYDLHPAVRGVAFDQLETSDRVGTYKALRDHFAAMPPEDIKRATELDHLKNSIEVFRLLLGAGLLKEAASHYFGELANALHYSIGAYRVVCELLRELLKAAGDEPWKVLGPKPASYVQGALTIALQQLGEVEEARALEAQSIALDLAEGDWANLAIEIGNVSMGRGFTIKERGAKLCLELAELTSNKEGAAAAHLSLAHVAAARGRYDEAREHLAKTSGSPVLEASIALETGAAIPDATGNTPTAQKDLLILRARFHVEQSNWTEVLRATDAAIEIVRRTGERALLPFGIRALALAELGREAEAREALANSSNNLYAAMACFALDLSDVAKDVLQRAYPYGDHWERERCRRLLGYAPILDPEPEEQIPHEGEILAALEKLRRIQEERKKRYLIS